MDLVYGRESIIVEEEDRISNLSDDIIHRILSFVDLKFAVQTCTLSQRWKHIWPSMPYLNLDNDILCRMPDPFPKFVDHALSNRNDRAEVAELELAYTGPTIDFVVIEDIVNYAYLRNVRKLSIKWYTWNFRQLPQLLFSSRTLKHLTLDDRSHYLSRESYVIKSAWDFPSLETLNLSTISLGDGGDKSVDIFSKCVNLKDLTLHAVYMHNSEIFNVCAPKLVNLTIKDSASFPKVFNVIAPQLKNFTGSITAYPYNFTEGAPTFLPLSTDGFNSLEKVNLFLGPGVKMEMHGSRLLNLFQIFCSAEFLILDVDIIQSLSLCLNQLLHEPCPFNNLKCLKINTMLLKQNEHIATVPIHVRNYLLQNSPSATFIMDFPQKVSQKRSREEVPTETIPKKVAKLETEEREIMAEEKRILVAKIQMQDQVIMDQKAIFEAQKLQHDNLMTHATECKMAEFKVLAESKSPDYEVIIRSMGMKSVSNIIPESLRVTMKTWFSSMYGGLKNLLVPQIDACKWSKIESDRTGNVRDFERDPTIFLISN